MVKIYPSTPPDLKHVPIDDDTLRSIGRLIRAFAEVEDIITLFICALSGISESKGIVLLGRTAISRRLEMAEYLALLRNDKSIDAYKSVFNADFKDCLECRNAVAHGVYLGQDDDGFYTFMTQTTFKPESETTRVVVTAYDSKSIADKAESLEGFIPQMESILQLSSLRQTRLQSGLQPHPKGQHQRSGIRKRGDPPQSSRG